ncbi:MAG: hypothetical protein QF724_00465 [Planctomycetota bacterium]|jgi:hypothetical protein|nr:hypothetical protein [Planctomycetota bacterium]MDP6370464.1 hypothetical protein [Planctomycetota bacterium]MDP6518461.1 hypothetical protein [Planctomycetota bacterium]MDP6837391.1 hypothetical protein [Planctomycetota bacterium]
MGAINSGTTALFDVLLTPFDAMGQEWSLLLVSGVFGILALIAFKHISYQKGIKSAKDRIKGHLIEIRIYQDDLAVVGKSIGKILLRNGQYVGLNFGPFIPLMIPFVLVLAQFVVRYAFTPAAIQDPAAVVLAGEGTTFSVQMAAGHGSDVEGLTIEYPVGVAAVSPLVRSIGSGAAWQEIVATAPGVHVITLRLADGTSETKLFAAGDVAPRQMQPERVQGIEAILWPAEAPLASDSAFARVTCAYPDGELGWLPGSGVLGVLLVFLVASMAFGAAVLKPLGIQI